MRDGFRIPLFLVAAMLLAACAPSSERADLVFINSAEVETLDPAIDHRPGEHEAGRIAVRGTVPHQRQGQAGAGRGGALGDVPKTKSATPFFLRKNARWSNGEPVTAHDFVRSWERVLKPAHRRGLRAAALSRW